MAALSGLIRLYQIKGMFLEDQLAVWVTLAEERSIGKATISVLRQLRRTTTTSVVEASTEIWHQMM